MTAQLVEDDERMQLGDDTCCGRSDSGILEFGFQPHSLAWYRLQFPHVHPIPTCVGPSETQLLRNAGSASIKHNLLFPLQGANYLTTEVDSPIESFCLCYNPHDLKCPSLVVIQRSNFFTRRILNKF